MRWALSWLLYGLGDLVSKPMHAFGWDKLYRPFNRLMCWSGDIQGEGSGPWQKVGEEESRTLDANDL